MRCSGPLCTQEKDVAPAKFFHRKFLVFSHWLGLQCNGFLYSSQQNLMTNAEHSTVKMCTLAGFLVLCFPVSLIFSAFLLLCFSASLFFLVLCFSASLLFAFPASLLFLLLCFSAFCFSCFFAFLLLCFPCFFAFVLLCLSTSTILLLFS